MAYGDAQPVLNGITLPRPNTIDESPVQLGDTITLAGGGLRRYDLGERSAFSLTWKALTEAEVATIRSAATRSALGYTHVDGVATTVLVEGRPRTTPVPGTSPVRFDLELMLVEQNARR